MTILDLAYNATSTPLMVTDHHYYPLEVEIANYLANEWSVPVLLGIFATVCASIVIGTVVIIDKTHPNLPKGEKAAIWWFVICEYFPHSILLISNFLVIKGERR
jgi:cholestenol delta-isomerase